MKELTFQPTITLSEQTFIAPDFAQTHIHNGNGSKAYVARIVGTSTQYGLKREFVKPDWSLTVGKRKSGVLCFPDLSPGIYEFRQFCINDRPYNWHQSGFFVITASGVAEISLETADAVAKELDTKDWCEIEPSFLEVSQSNEQTVECEKTESDSDSDTEYI